VPTQLTPEQLVLGLQIAAVALAAIWLLIVLDRNRWWPSQWSLHLDAAAREPDAGEFGEVVVVVPARNEAPMLPRTLPRLLKQAAWFRRVVVVDDRSGDKTAYIARRLAEGTAGEHHLRVISIEEPEAGWNGKTHAMQRGYEAATIDWQGNPRHQWVLFTEADVLHHPFSLSRIVSKAAQDDLDLVSVMVKPRVRTFWEWLLIPTVVYFFQSRNPFRKVSGPDARRAAASGGVILVRRSALEDADVFETIRENAADDMALAQAVRRSGGTCWLGLDPDMKSLRTHDTYAEIREMVVRTAFEQIGNSYVKLLVFLVEVVALFAAPPVLTVLGIYWLDPVIGVGAGLAWAMSLATYLPVVQYLEAPTSFVLALPLTALVYGRMALASLWGHLTGKQRAWRADSEVDLTGE
jgi:hopene-associated glycosyltransferase HpnB